MKKFAKVINIYFVIVILLFLAFIIKLFVLQIVDRKQTQEYLENKRYDVKTVFARRGNIFSSDGHKLAFDIEKYNIVLDPVNIPDEYVDKAAEILGNVIGMDDDKKYKLLSDIKAKRATKNHFLDLKIDLDYIHKEDLKKEIVKNIRTNQKWIFYQEKSERFNVQSTDFENIIGYFNNEGKPVYGIEKYYDKYLKGQQGQVRAYMPATQNVEKYTLPSLIDTEVIKEAVPGDDLHLTIDSVMQFALYDVLEDTYNVTKAETVMGTLMEADTGKILAMGTYPLPENKATIKNRPITDLFEPGSIFKPITVSSAIQQGLINENSVISSKGYIQVKDRIIHDHDRSTVGDLPLSMIIAKSGNVAMVKIGMMMETPNFYNYLIKYGLGRKTGIDTFYETNARMFPLNSFTEVRKSNVAFGQGINMTQLQMLTALTATINGGNVLKPYLVDYITNKDGDVVYENKPTVVDNPINEKTSKQVRDMLRDVVTVGTGRRVAIPGYELGGKTGTAQKAGPHGYVKGEYFSSFFAFFPANKPKYTLLITVNHPQGVYYGAQVALPAAKEILEKLIKYKGIEPTDLEAFNAANEKEEKEKPPVKIKKKVDPNDLRNISKLLNSGVMPDFTGVSLKDLLMIYDNSKYPKLDIQGSGNVVSQNIEPGKQISKSDKIILELK